MNMLFRGRLVLPDRTLPNGTLEVLRGRIHAVRRGGTRTADIDAEDGYIVPGFVDIHVHGGAGADYMDGTPQAVRIANRAHAARGTTTVFPTTTTGSPEQVARMLAACGAVKRKWKPVRDGARLAGVHLYGPYFAADKVGCHAVAGRRDPTPKEFNQYFETGLVRIATCAAELSGAEAFYRAARQRRCLITCGHSSATWADMTRAFEAGMRHVDHFWCAMSSVASLRVLHGTPMQASMEQFVLAHEAMSTEVIADGQHLAPELLNFAYRMKGAHRLCLVTDANRALGLPPGRYRFGPQEDGSWFESNGLVGFVPGSAGFVPGSASQPASLASSVVALDTMVRNMAAATGAPLHEVIRMASLTPAERTGIARDVGSLESGKRADLVILDKDLCVRRVFVGGCEVTVA